MRMQGGYATIPRNSAPKRAICLAIYLGHALGIGTGSLNSQARVLRTRLSSTSSGAEGVGAVEAGTEAEARDGAMDTVAECGLADWGPCAGPAVEMEMDWRLAPRSPPEAPWAGAGRIRGAKTGSDGWVGDEMAAWDRPG